MAAAGDAHGLVDYLNESWTAYHAVAASARRLRAASFVQLDERQPWSGCAPGGRYFFTRNESTLVAFAVGGAYTPGSGFVVVGAHTDSPCPKLKPVSKSARAGYQTVAVEPYGGGLWYTWFDRDLGLAGRVLLRRAGGGLQHALVAVRRPVLRISSLAIHLNRDVNSDGLKVNAQQHLPPVLATEVKAALNAPAKPPPAAAGSEAANDAATAEPERHHPALLALLASELGCAPAEIADFELQLCDCQPATLGGAFDEFVFSARALSERPATLRRLEN